MDQIIFDILVGYGPIGLLLFIFLKWGEISLTIKFPRSEEFNEQKK